MYRRCSSFSSPSASSSAIPRIAVIGVRISCDMLDRNSDLAREAASAASRVSTSSRSVSLSAVMSRPIPATPCTFPETSLSGKRLLEGHGRYSVEHSAARIDGTIELFGRNEELKAGAQRLFLAEAVGFGCGVVPADDFQVARNADDRVFGGIDDRRQHRAHAFG